VEKYLDHGSIVIAAITSCTNTSNLSVLLVAGLLAKKTVERDLQVPPWVKSSLAPGSRVVKNYFDKAGLMPYLDKLRFNIVGYGSTDTTMRHHCDLDAPAWSLPTRVLVHKPNKTLHTNSKWSWPDVK